MSLAGTSAESATASRSDQAKRTLAQRFSALEPLMLVSPRALTLARAHPFPDHLVEDDVPVRAASVARGPLESEPSHDRLVVRIGITFRGEACPVAAHLGVKLLVAIVQLVICEDGRRVVVPEDDVGPDAMNDVID